MPPQLVAAIISAIVSILIVVISRLVFVRTDRRFPILVLIQERLLNLESEPPWDTNGGGLWFHNIKEKVATPLDPYFDQLYKVSCPNRYCEVQKAWAYLKSITEESYNSTHPVRGGSTDLSKEELIREIRKVRITIKKG